MKHQIIVFLIFITSWIGHSQIGPNDQLVYLDSFKKICPKIDYNYYRVIKDYELVKDLYEVIIYFKSGRQEMRGFTSNKYNLNLNGNCMYYHENGNRKKMVNYYKNIEKGKQFEWYENGNIKSEIEIIQKPWLKTKKIKVLQFWDENKVAKVINGEGEYIETNEESKTISKGIIKNYLKEGKWVGTSKLPRISFVEYYSKGNFCSGVSVDSNQKINEYFEIQTNCVPKKGMGDLYKFVANNIKFPKEVINNYRGSLFVSMIIGADGKIKEINTGNKDEFGISTNLMTILSKYDEWIPTYKRGIPVDYGISFPVNLSWFN